MGDLGCSSRPEEGLGCNRLEEDRMTVVSDSDVRFVFEAEGLFLNNIPC